MISERCTTCLASGGGVARPASLVRLVGRVEFPIVASGSVVVSVALAHNRQRYGSKCRLGTEVLSELLSCSMYGS